MQRLDEAASGSSVAVRQGDSVRIVLAENATTGYSWQVAHDDRAHFEISPALRQYPAGGAIGSGGSVEFVVTGRKPGDGELELQYVRPWEGAASAIARFRLRVRVLP